MDQSNSPQMEDINYNMDASFHVQVVKQEPVSPASTADIPQSSPPDLLQDLEEIPPAVVDELMKDLWPISGQEASQTLNSSPNHDLTSTGTNETKWSGSGIHLISSFPASVNEISTTMPYIHQSIPNISGIPSTPNIHGKQYVKENTLNTTSISSGFPVAALAVCSPSLVENTLEATTYSQTSSIMPASRQDPPPYPSIHYRGCQVNKETSRVLQSHTFPLGHSDPPADTSNPNQQNSCLRKLIAKQRVSTDDQSTLKTKRRCSLKNMPDEEKKARRREQNRLAAQRCRQKKRQQNMVTQEMYDDEVKRTRDLEEEVKELRRQRDQLQRMVDQHLPSCPLRNDHYAPHKTGLMPVVSVSPTKATKSG